MKREGSQRSMVRRQLQKGGRVIGKFGIGVLSRLSGDCCLQKCALLVALSVNMNPLGDLERCELGWHFL